MSFTTGANASAMVVAQMQGQLATLIQQVITSGTLPMVFCTSFSFQLAITDDIILKADFEKKIDDLEAKYRGIFEALESTNAVMAYLYVSSICQTPLHRT